MYKSILFVFSLSLMSQVASSNPYPHSDQVPQSQVLDDTPQFIEGVNLESVDVLRVYLEWDKNSDSFQFSGIYKEASGTSALINRSSKKPELGSYIGRLYNEDGESLYDSVGTGIEYRKLVRGLSFRFPFKSEKQKFELIGEDPQSGEMISMLKIEIDPNLAIPIAKQDVTVRVLKEATQTPSLTVSIYSEGWKSEDQNRFWSRAQKAVNTVSSLPLANINRLKFIAVFKESKLKIERAEDLGLPVIPRDSYLGLYFPYWNNFGRWYHVVYPTSELKLREGLAQVPYDYPIVLIDSGNYFGVGNFNQLTAIPTEHSAFDYLLKHELGHYFGLNEEYEGGGPTELAFSQNILEPWSQNITFLSNETLKWSHFVKEGTQIPTPRTHWKSDPALYGAYKGGYADSPPLNHSHKPGLKCVMEKYDDFCSVCSEGISKKMEFDLGE